MNSIGPPWRALEELDAAIAEHVLDAAKDMAWRELGSSEEGSFAMREYLCGNVAIAAVYDRGLMDLELGPVAVSSERRSASAYRDLLDPPQRGRWNLGLSGSAAFVRTNWRRLDDLLSPGKWRETVDRVDEVARRRG